MSHPPCQKRVPACALSMVIVVVMLGLGCAPKAPDGAAAPAAADAAPPEVEPPVVTVDNDHLLFSFLDASGRVQAVPRVDAVPAEVRARVLVVDLAKTPEQRQAHRYAFFADLSSQRPDGTYPVTVVSRYNAADPTATGPSTLPLPKDGEVIVYSAVWCGYCKKAKSWLTAHSVPFVERDVEKTPGAQAELSSKLAKVGATGGGIPVIDWTGTLVMGFDEARLQELLAERKP